jgi:hypothetical protein
MDEFESALQSHLVEVKRSRKQRFKQGFSSFRAMYLFPLAVGMVPGKLLADCFFSAQTEPTGWLAVAYGTAILVCPFMFWHVRKDKQFESQRVFYTEALRRTLQDRGQLDAK